MGDVRGWVAATKPKNVKQARWLLRCTAGLTVWAYRSLGTSDVRTVLNPNNIEYWTMIVNAHRATDMARERPMGPASRRPSGQPGSLAIPIAAGRQKRNRFALRRCRREVLPAGSQTAWPP